MTMGNPKASDHAMSQRSTPQSQEPRTEPEIIPPGADGRSMRGSHASIDAHGTHRIYVAKLGPFGMIVLALVIAMLTAVILIVLLGAVLIWIPIAAVLVAAAVVSGLLRR
jgi:hypothetical protein